MLINLLPKKLFTKRVKSKDRIHQDSLSQESAKPAADQVKPISEIVNSSFLKHDKFSLWRVVCSVLFFVTGVATISWAGFQLLENSQIPECVYLVDEQRQLLDDELTQLGYFLTDQELTDQDKNGELMISTDDTNSLKIFDPTFSVFDSNSLGQIIVQIAGAVHKPGVYQISALQRIGDLIEIAGGLTTDADQAALIKQFNLASRLKDEQRIYIPFKQEQELQVWLDQYCRTAALSGSQTTSTQTTTNTTGSSNQAGGTTTTSQSTNSLNNYLPDQTGSSDENQDQGNQNPITSDCISINEASSEQLQTLSGIGPATATLIIEGRPYFNISDLLEVKGIGQATLEKLEPYVCL